MEQRGSHSVGYWNEARSKRLQPSHWLVSIPTTPHATPATHQRKTSIAWWKIVLNKSIRKRQTLQFTSSASRLASDFLYFEPNLKEKFSLLFYLVKETAVRTQSCPVPAALGHHTCSPAQHPWLLPPQLGLPCCLLPGNAVRKMNNTSLCFSKDHGYSFTCQSADEYSARMVASMPSTSEQRQQTPMWGDFRTSPESTAGRPLNLQKGTLVFLWAPYAPSSH